MLLVRPTGTAGARAGTTVAAIATVRIGHESHGQGEGETKDEDFLFHNDFL
jgi:hypothetical protein